MTQSELLKLISGVSSGRGKDIVDNHSIGGVDNATLKKDFSQALGIPQKDIRIDSNSGVVQITAGNKTYQINIVGQVKGSPTYANFKGRKVINRVMVARDENNKLGITDLIADARRAAVNVIKNDHRIKEAISLEEKIHYINQEITALQKDYLKIEDDWAVSTGKAARRYSPSQNIESDTERASTVNYQHQLEKDFANMGEYWKKYLVHHKKIEESWADFNDRMMNVGSDIVTGVLNGDNKQKLRKKYPEFASLINQVYNEYGFLGGTASPANRKRATLLTANEIGAHNINTAKEHQTGNVATLWGSNTPAQKLFSNIGGIHTKNAAKVAKANSIKLSSGMTHAARVVANNKDMGLFESTRDSHMLIAQQAANEMRYIARDFQKQISVKEILDKNKNFKDWNNPGAVKTMIRKVLESDKDFKKEMDQMTTQEMEAFYKNMEVEAQGFNDKAVAFNIRGAYKKDHFKRGSGKMVNKGGTLRSTALESDKDNFGTIDGIPITMLVGESLIGAKYTSDIIKDQLYKMVYYGTSDGTAKGQKFSQQSGTQLAKILNDELKTNSKFKTLRDIGFQFEVENGDLIYNLSTGDIAKGAEKLYDATLKSQTGKSAKEYVRNREQHLANFKDDIYKTFYQFLGRFNANLTVVDRKGEPGWDLRDKLYEEKRLYFLDYVPADVGAPLSGNASSGGFEGQRNVVENAKKFGKEFQSGIKSQYAYAGPELERRRKSWDQARQIMQTNQRLISGTHGTKIELADILPENFDPDERPNINNQKYVGDKLLASAFDRTTMGMILSKVASGELDLSKGGFINVPWIDQYGNERIGIPIEPISKADAEKLRKNSMIDTDGNTVEVYNSGDIDYQYSLFNDAFSLKRLYKAATNNATPEDRAKIGDKMLEYSHARSNSLFSNAGPEAEKYGKAQTLNSMRGVAHSVNSSTEGYTNNTIWLSAETLKRMLSRRTGDAKSGLSNEEAQAILDTWNAKHKDKFLDYAGWAANHKNSSIQDFLYDQIIADETKGDLVDLLVAGVNRDPTIGVDATKWARVRYSSKLTDKDIGVSDDLAWLVSGDFDGDQVRAALLSLGMDGATAGEIAQRYEQARVAQGKDTEWGNAIDKWIKLVEAKEAEEAKELKGIYSSEDAQFSNNPLLKELNAKYTNYAKTRIGNFGNNQFNALKLLSAEGTNLIGTNPAEAELFLAMMEQFYQEAISGKKLLEQAKNSADPEGVFKHGEERLDKLTELISDSSSYSTEEGRLKLLNTFQELLGIDTKSEDFFVNKKLKTQVLKRVASTQEGRRALYGFVDKNTQRGLSTSGFLSQDFNPENLTAEQIDALYRSSFFGKTNTMQAFAAISQAVDSQGRLKDLVYNKELDTNARAQAEHENIGPLFQSLEGSNQKLIDALNRLTNALEGKASGGAGGGGTVVPPYDAVKQLKLGGMAHPLSISSVTSAINPYGGSDDTAFLNNLLTNGEAKRFGYGTIKKLKQAAGNRPFASRLGNASGSMAELMMLLGVDTWAQALKKAGPGGKNLSPEELIWYEDVLQNQDELRKVADAYYGKAGINQKNYDFDKYFKENVVKVAEGQKKHILNYLKESGFELTGGIFPEAMVAGVLGDRTVTSRTDIGFRAQYKDKFTNELRDALIFGDVKNKDNGPLSLNDTMQAIFTHEAMRTIAAGLRNEESEEKLTGLVDTYKDQMKRFFGKDVNFSLEDLRAQFASSAVEDGVLEDKDLFNFVIKGNGKTNTIYQYGGNGAATDKAVALMARALLGGEDVLSKEEKDYLMSLMSVATDIGSIGVSGGGAGGGSRSRGGGGKGGTNSSALTAYKGTATQYSKIAQQIAKLEGSMNKMSPSQRALYQGYLGDLYGQRDQYEQALPGLYKKLNKEDVKLAEEYNKNLDLALKKTFTEQEAGAEKKSIFARLSDGIKMSIQRMFSFGHVGMRIVSKVTQSFQKIIGYAQQLDQAMVNIQIVTGKTRDEAFNLMGTYNQLAKTLGSTTTEVANSANVWFNESRDHIKPL